MLVPVVGLRCPPRGCLRAIRDFEPDPRKRGAKRQKGVYTSGLISKSREQWMALFLSGINHAREHLAEVLRAETDTEWVILDGTVIRAHPPTAGAKRDPLARPR